MRIRWLRPAQLSLAGIGDYIALKNPLAGARMLRIIRERVVQLEEHPESGRRGKQAGTRALVVPGTPYVVIYRIRTDVEILRVIHGAQHWPPE